MVSRSRTALLSFVLLLGFAMATDVVAFPVKQWEELTRRALAEAPRFHSDFARARWAMGVVEEELIRQNLRPNYSLDGRAIAKATTGDETTGACGHLAEIMAAAFKGAGIDTNRIVTVTGEAEGIGTYNPLWVNTNHAAVGVVVGSELIMFDPWSYAYHNGGWKGMTTSKWNGRSFPKWALDIDDYENFIWESAFGGNPEPQSSQGVQQEIVRKSNAAVARAAKRAAMPPRTPGQPASPAPAAGPAPSGAHWRLTGGPTFTKERNAEPVAGSRMDFTATGGPGTINVEYHSGDQHDPMGDRMQNYGTFVWSTSSSLQHLAAGTKLTVTGTLSHREEWSAGARVMAYTPKGLTIGYLVPDATAVSESVPVQGTWTVPSGGSHQPEMVLEFQCSNTGGIGRVKYFYTWGTGDVRTPQPQTSTGVADRWEGDWQSQWGPMVFEVNGTTVRGTFTHKGGRFEGHLSADGNSVMGKWTQEPTRQPPRDAGAFLFTLSADRRSFTGSYWYGMDSSTPPAGAWNAKR